MLIFTLHKGESTKMHLRGFSPALGAFLQLTIRTTDEWTMRVTRRIQNLTSIHSYRLQRSRSLGSPKPNLSSLRVLGTASLSIPRIVHTGTFMSALMRLQNASSSTKVPSLLEDHEGTARSIGEAYTWRRLATECV